VWSKKELIDKQAEFWVRLGGGCTLQAACDAVGVDRRTGRRWRRVAGGQIPRKRAAPSGRYLSLAERLKIADLHLSGAGVGQIAVAVGRSASTISRELTRNAPCRPGRRVKYLPYAAHEASQVRGRRPKASKFDLAELAAAVQGKLCVKWSPEQISVHLRGEFGDRAEMQVSPETIYQALFVQGRGQLRADLHRHLRTGRAVRRPHGSTGTGPKKSKIPNMVLISERPAEADDRAVPGHWEGDLILGSNCRSAIGTLVERQSRYVMLVHLPLDHSAGAVRDGLLAAIHTLPEHLRRSLTWDQGTELARHAEITLATEMAIYFCDPHSPWQRGSNENTNGLLRQYSPKGTDLSLHSPERLLDVATELNGRPRKTLEWKNPAQLMKDLLLQPPVATTA